MQIFETEHGNIYKINNLAISGTLNNVIKDKKGDLFVNVTFSEDGPLNSRTIFNISEVSNVEKEDSIWVNTIISPKDFSEMLSFMSMKYQVTDVLDLDKDSFELFLNNDIHSIEMLLGFNNDLKDKYYTEALMVKDNSKPKQLVKE